VPVEVLIDYLRDISEREGFSATADGLAGVATHAKGSVRDAMSLLEQVAALGSGKVESSIVARALGLADRDAFAKLATAVADQDAPAALALVSELAARGGDLRRFVAEAMGFFRGIFLAQYAPNLEEIADESLDTLEEWRRHAQVLSPTEVLRAVDQLSDALLNLRQGREERLVTELTLIRLTRPDASLDADALSARLERLEQRVQGIGTRADQVHQPVAVAPTTAVPSSSVPIIQPDPSSPPPDASEVSEPAAQPGADRPTPAGSLPADPAPAQELPAADVDLATFESAWPAIAARMRDLAGPSRHALLKEARPVSVADGTAVLELPAHLPFHLQQLRADSELHELLGRAAGEFVGGALTIEFRAQSETPPEGEASIEPTRAPDKDELVEKDEGAIDPTDLVVDMLGGEVIE
jgi:DNA polymerase-3 subunit gamma/tau